MTIFPIQGGVLLHILLQNLMECHQMIDMGKFMPQLLQMGFLHFFPCRQTGNLGIYFALDLQASFLHTGFAAFQEQIINDVKDDHAGTDCAVDIDQNFNFHISAPFFS